MNDEINKILDSIKYHIEEDDWFEIEGHFLKPLLDYITNLKQENERLKQEYINLKNYIVIRKIDSKVQDKATLYNIELENINKKRYEDYKSRCEKAVEYIEKHSNSFSVLDTISNGTLLNILNGRSDE